MKITNDQAYDIILQLRYELEERAYEAQLHYMTTEDIRDKNTALCLNYIAYAVPYDTTAKDTLEETLENVGRLMRQSYVSELFDHYDEGENFTPEEGFVAFVMAFYTQAMDRLRELAEALPPADLGETILANDAALRARETGEASEQ